jgi:hypothetical protein
MVIASSDTHTFFNDPLGVQGIIIRVTTCCVQSSDQSMVQATPILHCVDSRLLIFLAKIDHDTDDKQNVDKGKDL